MAEASASPKITEGVGELLEFSTATEGLWNWVLGAWEFLSPGERMILRFLHHISARLDNQETAMSELTDKLDAALAQLDSDESGIEAVYAAQQATITSLQNALAAAQAGEAADQAELQKALDAVTAANVKLSQLTGVPNTGTSTGTSTGDAGTGPSDPAAPPEPGIPSAPTDAVTVVGEPDAALSAGEQAPSQPNATGDGWSEAPVQIPSVDSTGTDSAGTDSASGTPTVS